MALFLAQEYRHVLLTYILLSSASSPAFEIPWKWALKILARAAEAPRGAVSAACVVVEDHVARAETGGPLRRREGRRPENRCLHRPQLPHCLRGRRPMCG